MFWLLALKIKSKLSAVIFVFVILKYIHIECLRVKWMCFRWSNRSSGGLVLSDIRRPSRNSAFYNVFAWQGSSSCNTALSSLQAFALREIKCRPCIPPPADLVVVTKMRRDYLAAGERRQGKLGNVYFHANIACIRSKQAHFLPSLLYVRAHVRQLMTPLHKQHLIDSLGFSAWTLLLWRGVPLRKYGRANYVI